MKQFQTSGQSRLGRAGRRPAPARGVVARVEPLEDRRLFSSVVVGVNHGTVAQVGGIEPNPMINPPDSMGAVGPDEVALLTNSKYALLAKDGIMQTEFAWGFNMFWAKAGVTTTTATDPHITYDPVSQRWFAVCIDNPGTSASSLLIAVSKTSNLNAMDAWKGLRVSVSDVVGGNTIWADFPTLGVDNNGLYVTLNMFTTGGAFSRHDVVAIPKSDLVFPAGGSPNVAHGVRFTGVNMGNDVVDIQPTIDFTSTKTATAPQILTARGTTGSGGTLKTAIFQKDITWSGLVPSLSATTITTTLASNFLAPPPGIQPGAGSDLLDSGLGGLTNSYVSNGKLYTIAPSQINGRAGALWFQFPITGSRQTPNKQGQLTDASADFLFPSITANASQDIVIGFTKTSSTQAPSGFVTGRLHGDAGTNLVTPKVTGSSTATYTDGVAGQSVLRWGDYSATVVDPSNVNRFFTFQERSATSAPITWYVDGYDVTLSTSGTLRAAVPTRSGYQPGVTGGFSNTPIGAAILSNGASVKARYADALLA